MEHDTKPESHGQILELARTLREIATIASECTNKLHSTKLFSFLCLQWLLGSPWMVFIKLCRRRRVRWLRIHHRLHIALRKHMHDTLKAGDLFSIVIDHAAQLNQKGTSANASLMQVLICSPASHRSPCLQQPCLVGLHSAYVFKRPFCNPPAFHNKQF